MIKKKKEKRKEKEKLLSPSINKEFESIELFVCVCVCVCVLSFIWGKMRTAAWEAASQIALRDCSKGVMGERQYIRFW